jgi:hypothetical protein
LLAAGALGSRAPQDADPWAAVQELQFERRRDPDEPGLLARYARALGEAGDEDAEIAYLLLARDGWARLGPDLDAARRQAAATASKRLGALDASLGRVDGHVDAYLRELSQVLRLYARNQRKPRNALDVAEAVLRRQPDHGATRALVDEIAASEPSLAAQVRRLHARLGLDRSRTFLLEWEERHDAWEDAGRVTTARYDVRCDIGYDLLHRAAYVLEEAADAYAAFFGVAHAPPAPTPVNLYRTEADYLQATSQRPPREATSPSWTATSSGPRPTMAGGSIPSSGSPCTPAIRAGRVCLSRNSSGNWCWRLRGSTGRSRAGRSRCRRGWTPAAPHGSPAPTSTTTGRCGPGASCRCG